jgi:hypothetical protein
LTPARKPSLAETHPDLAAQAEGWDPTTLARGSDKKVGWKCLRGHVWQATVGSRSSGTGCPYCSNKKVLAGYNDLATINPELASQAEGWDPTTVVPFSNKSLLWKCHRGHIWKSQVNARSKGVGCPVCSNKKVLAGFNDLATTHPEIAFQAEGWDPTTLVFGSSVKVRWKCSKGHIWQVAVVSRTNSQSGCPVCADQAVWIGYNDLATTKPELAAEADGWDPTTVSTFSNKKMSWLCASGHRYDSKVSDRSKGNGCPICSNQKILVGFNDLATTNPDLAAEADGWDPTSVSAKSGLIKSWRCSVGHTWKTMVAHRSNGTTCPTCTNKKILVGFNDLATTNPELAAQADGWDPTSLTHGSNKKMSWKCQLGHTWRTTVANRLKGKNCPYCSNQKVLAGYNDLASTNPDLAAQADGWDPSTITQGSNKKMSWKCQLGHTWRTTLRSRTAGNNCPVCSGRTAWPGFNDLATLQPVLAAQADGWDPSKYTENSGIKVAWICEVGHRWKAIIASRSVGGGCPSCAKFGFDPNKDAYLYLLEHFDLEMFQIGITNNLEERVSKHQRSGWTTMEVRGPMEGNLTRQLETASLHTLLKRGAVLGKKGSLEKFDGFTEAWTKASLKVVSIKQILDWVYEDEGSDNKS